MPCPCPAVLTTLQVATVAMATVVGTSLLVGADVDSGSLEGLEAFVSSLAAQAAAGANATQVRAERAVLASRVGCCWLYSTCALLHGRSRLHSAWRTCLPLAAVCAAPAHH